MDNLEPHSTTERGRIVEFGRFRTQYFEKSFLFLTGFRVTTYLYYYYCVHDPRRSSYFCIRSRSEPAAVCLPSGSNHTVPSRNSTNEVTNVNYYY